MISKRSGLYLMGHDGVEGAQPGLGLSVVEVEGAGGVSWVQDPNPLPPVFLQILKIQIICH